MKTETSNLIKMVAAVFAATAMTASMAHADVAKGQKLYQKKYKKECNMSGAKMAGTHTQDEWQEMKEEGKLLDYLNGQCGGKVQESHVDDLYDFFFEYGSDSGNVPSC